MKVCLREIRVWICRLG